MLLSNQARCLKCGDEPYSRNRHDYSSCKCGDIAVDGGTEYRRMVLATGALYEDISIEMPEDDFQNLKEKLREPLDAKNAEECCTVFINFMNYPEDIRAIMLPAAEWSIATWRNPFGLICAFARTFRDGEFKS